jgi:hypothetical protein
MGYAVEQEVSKMFKDAGDKRFERTEDALETKQI